MGEAQSKDPEQRVEDALMEWEYLTLPDGTHVIRSDVHFPDLRNQIERTAVLPTEPASADKS